MVTNCASGLRRRRRVPLSCQLSAVSSCCIRRRIHPWKTIESSQLIYNTTYSKTPTCSMANLLPNRKRSASVVAGLVLASVLHGNQALLTAAPHSLDRTSTGSRRPDKTMCFSKKPNDDDEGDGYDVQTRNPLRLAVLRLGMTEPRATSPFNYGKKYDVGQFTCAYCGQELFDGAAKYDSGSGWPSFWRTAAEGKVSYKREMDGRLECKCGRCNSHLGHVFLDGPTPSQVPQEILENSPESDPRGKSSTAPLPRFCVNGASLNYQQGENDN